jgi:hypothetical protein
MYMCSIRPYLTGTPWWIHVAGFAANDELTVTELSATGQCKKEGVRLGMRVTQFQGQVN